MTEEPDYAEIELRALANMITPCYACEQTGGHAEDCPVRIANELFDAAFEGAGYHLLPHQRDAVAEPEGGWAKLFAEVKALVPGNIMVVVGPPTRPRKIDHLYVIDDVGEDIHYFPMEKTQAEIEERLDLLIYGNHFRDALGERIDPKDVVITQHKARAPRESEFHVIPRWELEREKTAPVSIKETMRGNRPKRRKHKGGRR